MHRATQHYDFKIMLFATICNGTSYLMAIMRFYPHGFVIIRTPLSLTILHVKHNILQIIGSSILIVERIDK
jgi:hypothetical protein